MKISVVICTHNRADSLRRTLHSLTTQTLPQSEFEVLVVNNASTDNTQQVVESFASLPMRSIFEAKLGLSQARNIGWQAAKSPYVAFLDDDAEASKTWLQAILDTFTAYNNKDIVVGGRVEIKLPVPKPRWLDESLLFSLGKLTVDADVTSLNDTTLFLPGCNIAFSKQTLTKLGGFKTQLGRKGTSLLSGEEILLQQKLQTEGGSIIYNNCAAVTHHIAPSRLTKKWFLKRFYFEGVTEKKIESLSNQSVSRGSECVQLLQQVCSIHFVFKANFADMCMLAKRLGRLTASLHS